MIRFKDYFELTEGHEYEKNSAGTQVTHHVIDGHHVKVYHEPGIRPNEYNSHFEVDGTNDRDGHKIKIPDHAKQKILLHVGSAIEHFVSERKPAAIHMFSNDYLKDPIYHRFSKTLARRHKGKIEAGSGRFSVHFPENK